jgi:hypothetical protein
MVSVKKAVETINAYEENIDIVIANAAVVRCIEPLFQAWLISV